MKFLSLCFDFSQTNKCGKTIEDSKKRTKNSNLLVCFFFFLKEEEREEGMEREANGLKTNEIPPPRRKKKKHKNIKTGKNCKFDKARKKTNLFIFFFSFSRPA